MSSGLSTWTLITAMHKLAYDMEECRIDRFRYGLRPDSHSHYEKRQRQYERVWRELERRFKGGS